MDILIIFFPLASFFILSLNGRFLGKFGSAVISIGCIGSSLFLTFLLYSVVEKTSYVYLFDWLSFGRCRIPFEFLFDTTTFIMFFVVLGISFVVHIYSTDYLAHDPHLPRFLSFLSLFTFFMLILVSAENFVQLFLGWEGVGLCSFLLISFWYTRIQAGKAALKAVFVNKIGDLALLIAISLIYYLFGSLSFSVVAGTIPYVHDIHYLTFFGPVSLTDLIGLFLLVGVVGKSAQLGLHVWLPDAMEGPTPVSALLHAATMVTAGVFLVIRCSFLFEYTPTTLFYCVLVGSLTAFFAATVGLMQYDIKRIIAFSTCSQLGYMLAACGNSQYHTALFHLFNHAFFKALLFLAAGSVIHALQDEQDIRKMGGLFNFLPLTFTYFFIGSFSLMGLPYLSGFFSKDFIIEQFSTKAYTFPVLLLLGGAFCTAAYSFRLIYYVFLVRPNFNRIFLSNIVEASNRVQIPLIGLTILSIFSGWLAADFFIGCGSTAFAHALFILPQNSYLIDSEFLSPVIKQLPLIFSASGWFLAYVLFSSSNLTFLWQNYQGYSIAMFLNQKWFFDKIYNTLSLAFLKQSYYTFYAFLDKGIIEFFGPTGIYQVLWKTSLVVRQTQQGYLSFYFFSIFLFLIGFLLLGIIVL